AISEPRTESTCFPHQPVRAVWSLRAFISYHSPLTPHRHLPLGDYHFLPLEVLRQIISLISSTASMRNTRRSPVSKVCRRLEALCRTGMGPAPEMLHMAVRLLLLSRLGTQGSVLGIPGTGLSLYRLFLAT